jgi:hypothetical protein
MRGLQQHMVAPKTALPDLWQINIIEMRDLKQTNCGKHNNMKDGSLEM